MISSTANPMNASETVGFSATAVDLLKSANLDFSVSTRTLQTSDGLVVPNKMAIVRDDNDSVLGVVGRRYVPVQNRHAFEFLDSLVDGHELQYRKAGAFRGGAKVWMQVKLPGAIRVRQSDDLVDQYLLLCNTFDGSTALRVLFTPIRVACENSLNLALRQGTNLGVSIRHQGDLKSKIRETQEVFGLAGTYFREAKDGFDRLAGYEMSSEKVRGYFDALYPDPKDGENSRARATRDRLHQLFDEGLGQDITGIRHTAWAAYNAVTEWVDHHRPTRAALPSERENARMNSAWFGSGARLKAEAWKRALEMAV